MAHVQAKSGFTMAFAMGDRWNTLVMARSFLSEGMSTAGLQGVIAGGIPMENFSFQADLPMACQKGSLSFSMMTEPSSEQRSLPMAVAMALTLGGQMMGFFSSVRSGKQGSVSEPFSLTPCPEAWGFVPKGSYRNTPKRFGWLRPIDLYTEIVQEAFAKLPTTVCEAPATKRKRISTKPIAPAMGEERCAFYSSRREQNVVASFAKAS
jgi:hypothetical protein